MATKLDSLVVELTAKIDGLQASLRTASGDVKRFSNQAEKDIGVIDRAMTLATRAVVAFGGAFAALEVGKSVINAGVVIQQLENRLKAATGDLQVAGEAMAYVREEAERLGLDFQATADGFAGFSASALRAGLTFEQTKEIFTGVSEAATSMHLSTDRVALVFKALEQIAGKGTVSMEELRGQLGDSLPGAFEVAAKAMGVTNQEFYKMVSNGEVAASDFLPRFGDAIRKELGGSVEQASHSAQAAFNRLGNALFNLQADVARSGALDAVTASVNALTDALNDPAIHEGLKNIAQGLSLIVKLALQLGQVLAPVVGLLNSLNIDPIQRGLQILGKTAPAEEAKTQGAVSPGYTLGKAAVHMPSDKEVKAREQLQSKLDELLYKLGGIGMDEITRDAYDKQGDAQKKMEDEQKLLEDSLEQRLITEQDYRESMLKTELDYQEQLTKIKEEAEEQRSQLTEKASEIEIASRTKAVNAALGLMNTFGQRNKAMAIAALAIEKGMAIASTLSASYKSAMAARATYMALGNPAAAEAAYAREIAVGRVTAGLIAATTIAQVAMGGSGSGGGGGGGSAVTDENGTVIGGPVVNSQPKQVYINIQGSDDAVFNMRQVRKLMEQFGEAASDGTRLNVVVQ